VDVDTNDGVVYLTGTTNSQMQKARATEVAQKVAEVKRVVNNIQVQPAADGPTASNGAAATSPGDFTGRHTMSGQVVNVDHNNGHLTMKTDEGNLMLHFPPSSLTNVNPGDRVTVQLGIRPRPE